MQLDVAWSWRAKALPEEVREELIRRLELLRPYFPEMKCKMKIGITRLFDGLVFQSNEGAVKLMLDVHRTRRDGWKYPTYWTLAHELMHLAQFNSHGIPGGERACDVFGLSRVPPEFIDESPTFLAVPDCVRDDWTPSEALLAHELAKEAIELRKSGLKNYAVWWEDEFERRLDGESK
jgi:hypothetical protein